MVDRTPRTQQTRETEQRTQTWKRPAALPTPEPRDGLVFKWVRASINGVPDNRNVSMRFREGYVPEKAEDHKDLQQVPDVNSRFKGNLEVGGLLLCSIPAEIVEDRRRQMQQEADRQMESVDNNYLRESDPRMPVLPPERRSKVTNFGK